MKKTINKFVISLLFITKLTLLSCDTEQDFFWDRLDLNTNKVYLAYRGTSTKQGFYARDFNISDTLSSHVGLLINKNNKWDVFNVNDFKDNTSDLRNQSFKEFYDVKNEEIYHAAIYELRKSNIQTSINLINYIRAFDSIKVKFDKSFLLNDTSKLYCSEFVRNALFHIDSTNYNFKTHKRALKGVYKIYFKKDTLEYYPVDIFQLDDNIVKIKEWSFK